jgi:type IV secretory pathway VirB6-like protein
MVISPDFIIAVVGAASTGGPFGLIMSSLMGFCFIGLFRLLLKGIQIYAISFVVRALLLGLAPIFIVFLLFDRTRQTFTGWVNALVNMSLQPILFFTFISFFITMMTSSSNSLLTGVEFCWVETSGTEGSANKTSGWKIKDSATGMPEVSKLTWKGSVSCQLSGGPCEDFGINIVDILTFILLVYVAGKFAEVIDNLAADISNSFANLHTENRMDMRGGMMDKASGNTNAGGASPPKGTASALVTGRR